MPTILSNTHSNSYILKNGQEISSEEQHKAHAEFHAWADFCGLKTNWAGRAFGNWPVSFYDIIRKMRPTSRSALKRHIDAIIQRERDSGDLVQVQLEKEDLTRTDLRRMSRDDTHELTLKEQRRRKDLTKHYDPIAGRKDRWTLLNIKNIESLKRVILGAFEFLEAKTMIQSKDISLAKLCLLIARKHKTVQNRTARANRRTKKQRQEAARKGHKTRRKRLDRDAD